MIFSYNFQSNLYVLFIYLLNNIIDVYNKHYVEAYMILCRVKMAEEPKCA